MGFGSDGAGYRHGPERRPDFHEPCRFIQLAGGGTNRGGGEFLYGTVTVGSDGRIFSTYFVPRWRDRNTFSGTMNLATGIGSVNVRVNGRPSSQGVQLKIRTRERICFDGSFEDKRKGGKGIFSGIR